MTTFDTLYAELLFRLQNLTWVDGVDLLLVTISFYLLLALLRRSQAAFLLRGIIALAFLFFVTTSLFRLPTFDLLLGGAILAILIVTPITLQPELRRWLERFGRRIGLTFSVRQDIAERVIPPLLHAVENFSSTRTGALIVLEGETVLQGIIGSGVAVDGRITAELLQTVFFDKTPLHDGAVVLRGDKVVAASCVLPLTEQLLTADRRLGTRHRAAVGMSEQSDALVIVVSEETGTVSVAKAGELERHLDSAALRQRLYSYYTQTRLNGRSPVQPRRWRLRLPRPQQLLVNLFYLFIAFLLALTAAGFVRERENPIREQQFEEVPLRMEGLPEGMALLTPLPTAVAVNVRATNEMLSTLRPESFQALISLADGQPGLQRYPISITTSAESIRILTVAPSELDLELAPIITRTVAVVVNVLDREALSTAYTIAGEPTATPAQVVVEGAAPLVAQVARAEATITLGNATTAIREPRPLRALDQDGREAPGVTLQTRQAQVYVAVQRRVDALDVGIHAVTINTPPAGYWLSSLSVIPASVTLRGHPSVLAAVGNFVDTLPVDLSEAVGELRVQIPLDLPDDVQSIDSRGNIVTTVTVVANVAARRGDLLLRRPVQLVNPPSGVTVAIEPKEVELLLSGPLPILNEIERNPDLVRVVINGAALTLAQSQQARPEIILPDGVRAQLINVSVLVTTTRE